MIPDNIDLTRNRDFGNRNGRTRRLTAVSNVRSSYKKVMNVFRFAMWEEMPIRYSHSRVFPQGNKDDFYRFHLTDRYRNGMCGCDRCGRKIMAWYRYETICNQCINDVDYEIATNERRHGKYPWTMPKDDRDNREVLLR